MQRALIDRIGGFSEEFVNGSDVELSHRVWRDGTAMFYATDALVAYRYRTTPLGLARQARNYGKVNAALVATFRAAGTEIPTSGDLRGWIWLMRKLPLLTTRAGRARWMWAAGTRVGRLEGRLRRDAAFLGDHVHRAR
jgi:GT2 family glycosyltransferase